MTKIIAMLSLYNEPPELIDESISRVKEMGADFLLCCDGPYDLYPSKEWDSPPALSSAARWSWGDNDTFAWFSKHDWVEGNEVEKRNFMLERALEIADEGDWILVFDADHMWEQVGEHDLKTMLEGDRIERVVAEVSFADCLLDAPDPSWYEACLIYRAIPGMVYEGAHWRIRFPDGSVSTTLRTTQEAHTAPTIDLRDYFRVRHTVFAPELALRRARQTIWYGHRDSKGLEK